MNNIKRNTNNRLSLTRIAEAWQSEIMNSVPDSEPRTKATGLFHRFREIYQSLYTQPRTVRRRIQKMNKASMARVAFMCTLGMACQFPAEARDIWLQTRVPDASADEKCSLIEAIENANADSAVHSDCLAGVGADTILLWKDNSFTLTAVHNDSGGNPNGLPVITSDITIDGRGSTIERRTTEQDASFDPADVEPAYRLFEVAASGNLSINDTTLQGGGYFVYVSGPGSGSRYGYTGPGGAIFNAGHVTLQNSVLDSRFTHVIDNSGTMLINNSVVRDSVSSSGGGIDNSGVLELKNSTISNTYQALYNTASGVSSLENCTFATNVNGVVNHGDLSIRNCTISGNRGAAVVNSGNLDLNSNLISGNKGIRFYAGAYTGFIFSNTGTVTSQNNILGDDAIRFADDGTYNSYFSSGFTADPSDITATIDGNQPTALADIFEIMLQNNGGSTETLALVPGSIAIDAVATADCPASDQRGVARPQSTACDVGAFEYQSVALCDLPPVSIAGSCKDEFVAHSIDDIDAYVASNFGRQTNIKDFPSYKNLRLVGAIGHTGIPMDVTSPCRITVNSNASLIGSDINLHARQGVTMNWSANIDSSGQVCMISDKRSAFLNGGHAINANSLAIRGKQKVVVGFQSTLNVTGPAEVVSTGSGINSQAKIANKTIVVTDRFTMAADNLAELAFKANISSTGELSITSGALETSAIVLFNQSSTQSGSDMVLSSGGEMNVGYQASVAAGNHLGLSAKTTDDCTVSSAASITYGSKSGNCTDKLP